MANTAKKIPILLGLLIGGFMGMFSETALNIALTPLMTELHLQASTLQWLVTGYMLVIGVLVPVSGLLVRWFSTRQLLLFSLTIFLIGTFCSAISVTFTWLMIGRLIQGIATGIIIPLIFTTVVALFPPQKRGAALGLVGLVIMFAPAIGPTVAGFILQVSSWRWIFWCMIPFLVLAFIVSAFYCKNVNDVTRPPIDMRSIFLSTIGFGGIVLSFSSAGELGLTSMTVLLPLIVGLVSLFLFSMRQIRLAKPLLNLSVFRYSMFTVGCILIVFGFSLIMSTMLLLPMYWQQVKSASVALTGLLLLPGGIINGVLSTLSGRLYDRFGPKWLVRIGFIILIFPVIMLVNLHPQSTYTYVVSANLLLMIGAPCIMSAAQAMSLNALPKSMSPDGSAIMNTLQQVSGAVATALTTTLLTFGEKSIASGNHVQMINHGIRTGFIFTLIVVIGGLCLSIFVKTSAIQKQTNA